MTRRSKPARPAREAPEPEETPSAAVDVARTPEHPFPIVGIGASAGGLEALESFLANVPAGSGMAFVIIQHLDPTRKGMLVRLLQRGTTMPVVQAKDRMRVKPNSVYVIPPNKDMSILHGFLHLLDPVEPRGLRLPIDFFFRALADDQRERSIGVILSGMGSDGTLGLRAIKEKAGLVVVQNATSAKFDGMPRSAIDAGLADVIAPVEELPGKIAAYLQHVPLTIEGKDGERGVPRSALEKVVLLLRTQTGHDFSLYKRNTIHRRVERRRGLHQIARIDDYVRFLRQNPQEVELLFRELLIGVTSFFRDPEAWERLKAKVLPALLAGHDPHQALRAWIPACSTGEEAYSLAILFMEALEELAPGENVSLQIFATDLDQQAIEKARAGWFPPNIAADVSAKRLDRFFVTLEHGYRVSQPIREMIIFAPQNLVTDPPFGKLDILCCRNLLIYLTPKLQEKLLPLLHYSLSPGGFLFLGSSESIGRFDTLFEPVDRQSRLYRRLDPTLPTEPIELPATFVTTRGRAAANRHKERASIQTMAEQLLLQKYSPAAALTNNNGDIVYISGRTGKYLEPATGKANWNVFAMAREGLRNELTSGLKRALRQKETVDLKNVVVITEGEKQVVDVTIQPLSSADGFEGMVLLVFNDVARLPREEGAGKPSGQETRAGELDRELQRAHQDLKILWEEMQTSEEELRSANEELQSANEELQSMNEELTTSREELQSMNEELHTVNQELQTRLDEVSRIESDMRNLLDSTGIATLFLDRTLCVRRFTSAMRKLTKLIAGDVGRPITDIASALIYPELAGDAREVMETRLAVEREISTPDDDWFAMRILPYWTEDSLVDGVVMTFMDITASKNLEAELRATRARMQERMDQEL